MYQPKVVLSCFKFISKDKPYGYDSEMEQDGDFLS